jgi:hypothetical protein
VVAIEIGSRLGEQARTGVFNQLHADILDQLRLAGRVD